MVLESILSGRQAWHFRASIRLEGNDVHAFQLRGESMSPFVVLLIRLLVDTASINQPKPDSVLDLIVRPTDIDVKGHVNNARYVEYLQWGRWQWFDEKEFSIERQKEAGCALVVVNLNLNYRSECAQGERLTVHTRPEKIGDKSFSMRQEIWKQDGSIALEGVVTMVAIDPSTRKSRPLPEQLKKLLVE